MNSLSRFISEFRNGFQQADRFVCQIFVPPTMIANIIRDSAAKSDSIFGIIDRVLSVETAVLSVPQVVKWLGQGLLVTQTTLPDRSFGQVSQTMYGYTEKFPSTMEHGSLSCVFAMPYTLGADNGIPRFFNYWMNQIQNADKGPQSGFNFNFPQSYYATILLTLLDRKNHGTLTYKFENVYPKTVNSLQVDWNATTQFISLSVAFTYSYWTMLPLVESQAISFIDNAVNSII